MVPVSGRDSTEGARAQQELEGGVTLEGSMKPPRFIERGGNKGGDQTERKKARRLEGRAERRGGS